MQKRTKCDMCGNVIENGKCSCGSWKEEHEFSNHEKKFKAAIEAFHEMKQFTFTMDAPHLGVAVVFFRGDYKECKNVEKFIQSTKGRPFYEE